MFDDLFVFVMITVDVFQFDNDLFRDGGAYEWIQCAVQPVCRVVLYLLARLWTLNSPMGPG